MIVTIMDELGDWKTVVSRRDSVENIFTNIIFDELFRGISLFFYEKYNSPQGKICHKTFRLLLFHLQPSKVWKKIGHTTSVTNLHD